VPRRASAFAKNGPLRSTLLFRRSKTPRFRRFSSDFEPVRSISTMFRSVAAGAHFPELETAVLKLWRERDIYAQSIARRADAKETFVFFEGPPTANGMPHPGHCLTRAIKDLFPRYQTMRGRRCTRKAGWDTHGLPVEVEVCKELGIHSK
jgi:isoleucyl-tRNA synthetase